MERNITVSQAYKTMYRDYPEVVGVKDISKMLAEGVVIRAGNCLFVDFLSHWLDTVKPTIAYTTYCSYMGCIQKVNNYFNEKYPELLLCEITPLQIQQFYNDLYNSGLTGNTVKHYHANIHKALKYAVKMDMLSS